MAKETFEEWAVVEIMGHARYAGLVSEQTIGGTSFVRVDVPDVDELPAFTKLFGASAIFSITSRCWENPAIGRAEADWEVVPSDPILLSHVHGTLYAVLAQWDLTELERAVLRGRQPDDG